MATITFEGLDAYMKQMEGLGRDFPKVVNAALFEGAKVVADAVRGEIDGLKDSHRHVTDAEIQGLKEGLGVAHFWNENGKTLTKIGFDGYNSYRTKKFPKGHPNVLVARSIIRGTSWVRPDRFVDRAAKKSRQEAIAAIQERLDAELKARSGQ